MDTNLIKTITARFYEDAEWKHVEDLILVKMDELQEFSEKDMTLWGSNAISEIRAKMLCYNILKDFLAETKLVNREIPIYKNKFK